MKKDQLEEIKKEIKTFYDDRDWSQFHDPKNLAISLNLEASEVLELFQWTKNNDIKDGKKEHLADELSDVLIYLIAMYEHFDIDIIKAFKKKMKENADKYPVEKAKGVSTKYNELD